MTVQSDAWDHLCVSAVQVWLVASELSKALAESVIGTAGLFMYPSYSRLIEEILRLAKAR